MVRDSAAADGMGRPRRRAQARVAVGSASLAVLRVAVVRTLAVLARLGELVHPLVVRVTRRPSLRRDERPAPVVVDHVVPVRIVEIVLKYREPPRPEVHPAVAVVAVLQPGALVNTVFQPNRVLLFAKIVDVQRTNRRAAHPRPPE